MAILSTLSLFMILVGLVALGAVTVYGLNLFKKIAKFFEKSLAPLAAFVRLLGWYAVPLTVTLMIGSGWFVYTFWFATGPRDLASHKPPLCVEVKDKNGALIDYACTSEQLRLWRPLAAIDPTLRALVVMLEDDKFYEHGGLDLDEIWNAIEKDIEKKKIVRGGSTITQQLAKNLFLSKEKTLVRKATEVPLALRIENELSKDQILELYLNTIEWGPGVYGAEIASRLYFDHDSYSLRPEEAWLLALMIPNPKELNLWLNPKAMASLLKRGQNLATRLVQGRKMSRDAANQAFANFENFLKEWMAKKPTLSTAEEKPAPRIFPAAWAKNRHFNLAQIPSVLKQIQKVISKKQNPVLETELDAQLHAELQQLNPKASQADDPQKLVLLVEGGKVRAVVPDASGISQSALAEMAETHHLEVQRINTKTFPSSNFIR